MKSRILYLVVQMTCFIAIFLGCAGEQGEFRPENPSAKIYSFFGNVIFHKKDLSKWEEAEINQHLYPEKKVQTDEESTTKLIYVDASKVTLAPEIVMVIQSIEPVEEKRIFLT